MTNHWIDIKNTDCVLMIGSNAAENHPVSFKWIEEARRNNGAKLIVVDPRITRSAAKADLYGRIRSGTDIAFIGGLINYALTYGKYNANYALNYTNLAYLIDGAYDGNDVANKGIFTGMTAYHPTNNPVPKYDKSSWAYQTDDSGPVIDGNYPNTPTDAESVFDILRTHYSRYTPDMVSSITGIDKNTFLQIAEAYCNTGNPGQSGTIMYAMGTTQHTYGTQNIRSYAILQLLLGNMGVAGGGINALRGESNVQGSTDMCLLHHILPGYLGVVEADMLTLGLQTSPATVKNSGNLTGTTTPPSLIIDGLTGIDRDEVRAGDRIRITTVGAPDYGNVYVIEAVINATSVRVRSRWNGTKEVDVKGGILNNWTNGNGYSITSESAVDHTVATDSYLGQCTKKALAGVKDVLGNERLSADWWQYYPKYMMSLLAAWWGGSDRFTAADPHGGDFGYQFLPKVDPDTNYSHINIFEHINALGATVPQMMMCWGQNPAVGGPQSVFERQQLEKLDTLVCVDLWETETSAFWKPDASGNSFGTGTPTANIDTTVYLLPAKASMEKEGSISNSGRWLQWRYPARDGSVEFHKGGHLAAQGYGTKADLDIINDLMLELKSLYAGATTVANGLGIAEMTWGFETDGYGVQGSVADPRKVAREVNGFVIQNPGDSNTVARKANSQKSSFGQLLANIDTSAAPDEMTVSGNWLYCGSYVEPGADLLAPQSGDYAGNRMTKRVPVDNSASGIGLFSNWSWCWPINRRIIYNRASLNPTGGSPDIYEPWSDKWVIKYDYTAGGWAPGGDVPDGGWKPEDYMAFIMKEEGASHIWGPGRVDGPLPEHYEPAETPLAQHPFGTGHCLWNPTVIYDDYKGTGSDFYQYDNESTFGDRSTYPVVGTTYRLVEHWQAGAMTRNLPWLVELQPDMFCEMSEEFAASFNPAIQNGDTVKVTTARNTANPVTCVALVTKRFKPFDVMGSIVHQVGLPWHFGYRGLGQGNSANLLTPHIGDPNTRIPEYKAFLCKVEPA